MVLWLYLDAILTRNLEGGSRITCKHRSHDQNGKFQKFKTADARHFENIFRYIQAGNQLISMKFSMRIRILIPRMAN